MDGNARLLFRTGADRSGVAYGGSVLNDAAVPRNTFCSGPPSFLRHQGEFIKQSRPLSPLASLSRAIFGCLESLVACVLHSLALETGLQVTIITLAAGTFSPFC